ncbi:MAG: hypothetical protein ACK41D_05880 [Rubricoccaceae bacterium]
MRSLPALPAPLAALAAFLLLAPGALAQPIPFGSGDDPLELDLQPIQARPRVWAGAYAGPAFVRNRWRVALAAEAEAQVGRVSVGVAEAIHPAAGGLYGGEFDAPYDALRVLRYARLNPTPTSRLYARLGPVQQVELGVGHLVRRYGTAAAWDERTVGAEAAAELGPVRLAAFTGDVRLNTLAGAEIDVATRRDAGRLRGVRVSLAGVHDFARPPDSSLTGLELVVRGDLLREDVAAVRPFVSAARYLRHGQGLGGGRRGRGRHRGDLFGARARVGVFASSRRFVPGHAGPFYSVAGGPSRILAADPFFDPAAPRSVRAGVPLEAARAGLALVADVRVVRFRQFEAYQHVRRHVGPGRQSAYGLRLAARLAGDTRAELLLERQGFRSLLGQIGRTSDEQLLVLDVARPLGRPGYVFVRSRYGYRLLRDALPPGDVPAADERAFLIERRFEPLVGLRLSY